MPARRRSADLVVDQLFLHLEGGLLDLYVLLLGVSQFGKELMIEFVKNLIVEGKRTLEYMGRMARYLFIPLFALSLLSFSIIHLLSAFQAYLIGNGSVQPIELLCESLTVMIFVIILCSAVFGFSPGTAGRFLGVGIESATYAVLAAYFILSLASSLVMPVLWLSFLQAGVDLIGLRPGPVFLLNSVALVGLLVILAALFLRGEALLRVLRWGGTRFGVSAGRVVEGAAVGLLVLSGVAVIRFGLPPLALGLWKAAGI